MLKKQEIIFLEPGRKKSAKIICDIFSYRPVHVEEVALGELYTLSQYQQKDGEFHSLINLINSALKRSFYQKPEKGTLDSFKAALKEANRVIADFSQTQNSQQLLKQISFSILIAKKDRVYLSSGGRNLAFIFRDNLINLNEKMVPPPEKNSFDKFFQSFVSGDLANKDKIVLTSEGLLKLVEPGGLKQIFKTETALGAVEKINKLVREQKKAQSLAVLLLTHRSKKSLKKTKEQKQKFITPPIDLRGILK